MKSVEFTNQEASSRFQFKMQKKASISWYRWQLYVLTDHAEKKSGYNILAPLLATAKTFRHPARCNHMEEVALYIPPHTNSDFTF